MSSLIEEIFQSFSCSLSQRTLPSALQSLFIHLLRDNKTAFTDIIESIFLQLSSQFDKNRLTRRGLNFLLSIFNPSLSSDLINDIKSSFKFFFNLLTEGCEASTLSVRHCSAWTLFHSLKTLEILDLSSTLQKKLLKTTKKLSTDKNHKIRLVAVKVLSSLDDQSELLSLLSWEGQKNVKKLLIKKIKISKKSENQIAKKLKDADSEVRLAALQVLMPNLSCFKKVLPLVFHEKDEKVRDLVFKFIQKFLETYKIEGLVNLFNLKMMSFRRQVEVIKGFEFICMNVMNSQELMKNLENFKLRVKDLNLQELILLRFSCQALNISEEYQLQLIMGEFLPFLSFLHPDHPVQFSDTFLKICQYFDLGEELIRSHVIYTLSSLLITFPLDVENEKSAVLVQKMIEKQNFSDFLPTFQEDVLVETVKTLKKIMKDDDEGFQRIMLEVLNEIVDPWINRELKKCFLRQREILEDKLAMLKSELIEKKVEENAKNLEFSENFKEIDDKIKEIEEKIKEIDDKIEIIVMRTCIVLCEVLRQSRVVKFLDEISNIFDIVVYPALKCENILIKGKGLEAFGVFCLKKAGNFHDFLEILQKTLKEFATGYVEMIALTFVIDFLMIYDFEKASSSQDDLINILTSYKKVKNQHFQLVSIQGLCKLFTIGRLERIDILSDLLFQYFLSNPTDQIKQYLHIFLLNYSKFSLKNSKILANSYFLTVSRVKTEFHSDIDKLASIHSFILASLDPEKQNFSHSSENLHFYLFFILSQKLLTKAHSNHLISRLVLQVKFCTFNYSEAKIASFILQDLKNSASDKTVRSALEKIDEQLKNSQNSLELKEMRGLEENERQLFDDLRKNFENLEVLGKIYTDELGENSVKKKQKYRNENKENEENNEKNEGFQSFPSKRQRLS